jgi:hypothetical protein
MLANVSPSLGHYRDHEDPYSTKNSVLSVTSCKYFQCLGTDAFLPSQLRWLSDRVEGHHLADGMATLI